MKRRHRELMDEVRAAKPSAPLRAETWARSERAKQILEGILADSEGTDQDQRNGPRLSRPRLAWLAGAVVLVGLALFLAFYLVPGPSGHDRTASRSTLNSSQGAVADAVSKAEALREIVALFHEMPGYTPGLAPPLPGKEPDALESARALGLVRGSEVPIDALGKPATRREFALWVWRGWSLILPVTAAVPPVADLKTLGTEEVQAVDALVALDIMRLDKSGAFRGDEGLTAEEAVAALARLRVVLEQ